MSKKPPMEFPTYKPPVQRTDTAKRARQLLAGRKRLFVEVSKTVHQRIRVRALPFGNLKEYILWAVENRESMAKKDEEPFPSTPRQARIIIEVTDEEAERLLEKAKPWKTFREYVLRCLEADGVQIP